MKNCKNCKYRVNNKTVHHRRRVETRSPIINMIGISETGFYCEVKKELIRTDYHNLVHFGTNCKQFESR